MRLVSTTGTYIRALGGLSPEKPELILEPGSKFQESTLGPAPELVGMIGLELAILSIADCTNKSLSVQSFLN